MTKPYTYQRGIELPKHAFDLTGQVFGRLTVLEPVRRVGWPGFIFWRTICVCGEEHYSTQGHLKSARVASCGCHSRETVKVRMTTHGMRYHPAYRAWTRMRQRCINPKHTNWSDYGGRGIKVRKKWLDSFENFWFDMGLTYRKGAELHRKDTDSDYYPENCVWRVLIQLDTPWGSLTLSEASQKFGVPRYLIVQRLTRGWDPVEAMTLKPHEKPTKINLSP